MPGTVARCHESVAEGPARVLPRVQLYREEGKINTSRSLESIVAVLGLPRWHGRHPWLAMPLNIANYLAFSAAAYRDKPLPLKLARWLAVFTTCLCKQGLLRAAAVLLQARALLRTSLGPRTQPPRR